MENRFHSSHGAPAFAFLLVAVVAAVLGLLTAIRGGRLTAPTGTLLGICAVSAVALVTISMLTTGHTAMYSIILVGFFNSIMFPSIFTLGVAELGPLTGDGSGVMIMAIVGGAIIPVAQGWIADHIGIPSRLLPAGHLLRLHSVLCFERLEAE